MRKSFLCVFAILVMMSSLLGGIQPQASAEPGAALGGAAGSIVAREPQLTPGGLGSPGLEGLQYADPTSSLAIVDPPEANNQGSAELTHPIPIPAGRGIQPDLTLSYSSGADSSWLGTGWDLSVGAITIDTRWGVPRFLGDLESETYLLNGAQLSPTAIRSTLEPRVADRADYTLRTETEFNHIIRHGDSPQNYWWEVIDKLGNHFWYGGFPDDGGPNGDNPGGRDNSAILSDDHGNAYRWALSAQRDVGVNVIRYHYETVPGERVGADGETLGKQLYLKSIRYTEAAPVSGQPADPPYEVRLLRDDDISPTPAPRKDVIIDARGGFLEVTSDLLRSIEIWHGEPNGGAPRSYDTLVKRYNLNYTEGAFGKSLLTSVDQIGADGVVYATNAFDYYDDVRDASGDYDGFEDSNDWDTGDDSLEQILLGPQEISALGGSESNTGDAHIYLGFNVSNPTKTGSFGGSLTIKGGATEGLAEFLDINGDLLPDKVFRKTRGGSVQFRLNTSGPDGGTTFASDANSVVNLDNLSTEWNIGVAGAAEAYFGASVQFSIAGDVTVGEDYFTDVNADGLPDFVSAGKVYFNYLDNGIPTFSTDSSLTSVPIDDGTVNLPEIQKLADVEAQMRAQSPLQDTVRRWVAPFNGTVAVSGTVTFSPSFLPSNGVPIAPNDGVRVAIQHKTDELWAASLVTPGQSATPANVSAIAVSAGDAIYFRVGSVDDGAGDQVTWDPTITYTSSTAPLDVNDLSQTTFNASDDFTLAGRPDSKIFMPLKGTVKFEATLRKTAVTSDDVTVLVLHNGVPVPGLTQTISADTVNTDGIDISGSFAVAAPTATGADEVEVRLAVDSPIDVTALDWAPRLYYDSAVGGNNQPVDAYDDDGNPTLSINVPADIDIYPHSTLTSPSTPWTSTMGQTVKVHAEVGASGSPDGGDVVLTVKSRSGLVGKAHFTVPGGTLTSGTVDLVVALESGQEYWFDLSVRDPALSDKIIGSSVSLNWNDGDDQSATVPSTLYSAGRQGIFPISYRGWSYAGYNADGDKATAPIDESAFVINVAEMPQAKPTGFDDTTYNNPAQADSFAFVPTMLDIFDATGAVTATVPVWRGFKDNIVGGADFARSSRSAADSPSLVSSAAGSGQRATRRVGVTAPTLALLAGLGPVSASFGAGPSFGLLDYVDLNGDSFPDIVAPGYVSYTGPRGGYYDEGDGVDIVGQDTTFAVGAGFSGSAVEVKGNSKGDANSSQDVVASSGSGAAAKSSGSARQGEQASADEYGAGIGVGGGISGSFTNPSVTDGSWNDVMPDTASLEEELVDVNGDGLPDKVSMNPAGVSVRLNLGYGFMEESIPWAGGGFEVNESFAGSLDPGLGFQFNNKEYSGGISYSESVDMSRYSWNDIDGDGVLDRLRKVADGDEIMVAFGSGAGILPEVHYGTLQEGSIELIGAIPTGEQIAQGRSRGLGGGADFSIGIGPLCLVACYIIVNPGVHFEHSVSWNQVQLTDVDGDGYPDSVRSDSDDEMSVRRNKRGRTNLLKSVANPIGGEIRLDYARNGNTTDQPYSQWNLARVEVDDNRAGDGPDTLLTTYEYADNAYNSLEREFLGYALVTEQQRDIDTAGEPLVRSIERAYLNGSVFESGLMTRETMLDPSNAPLRETINTWELVDLATNGPADLDASGLVLLGKAMTPQLTKVEQRWFTGDQSKNTWTTFTYDDLGNVIEMADIGEPAVPTDDVVADITYSSCDISASETLQEAFPCPAATTSAPQSPYWNANRCPTWTSIPAKIEIRDGSGNLLRSRDGAPALCDNSSVTELTEQVGDGTTAVTLLSYDSWGSYNHIEYPVDANGDRYIVDYVYDPNSEGHIARVEDSLGFVSTATFDGRFGLVTSRVDANGQQTSYDYDAAGCLASVTLPYEQGTGQQTIRYEYHPTDPNYAYAVAHHFDAFHPGDTIDTATFTDGIGRTTQTKQDATFFRGADQPTTNGMAVSGAVEFDVLGRPIKQWYPTEEPAGQIGTYNMGTSAAGPTVTTYDLRDLVTRVDNPSGSFRTTSYSVGSKAGVGDNLFLTHQVDEEGKAQDTYSDVRDNVLGVEVLPGGNSALLTRYSYNGLGDLLSVLDNGNNATTHTYDMLGRRTSTQTPDAGLVEFRFDGASNLIQKVTPNLRAQGQAINYSYNIGQLLSIDYPDATPDVTYTYGGPGAANNGAGRVIAVHDAARDQQLTYGRMGEVTNETTTMLVHNLNDETEARLMFTTLFDQDSYGRYKTVTYPDGEVLSFDYDAGGLVNSAIGQKAAITYPYIERREYDEFFARRFDQTGEGVKTETSYDANTRRLTRIQAISPTIEIQDLNYTYDRVGNVLKADNQLPPATPELMGGPSVQTFSYDENYRLVSAQGTYDFAPDKQRNYTYDLVYNNLGNLTAKSQTDAIGKPGKKGVTQKKTTYDFKSIEYTNDAPHQISRIAKRPYTHDLNGNFTGWTDDKTGQNRSVVWDAADRAISVADQGATTRYTYDESNRLAIERGPGGETSFVNQWYTVRNGTVAYKHIWVDGDRVATQRVFDDGEPEFQRYFLHKDLQQNTNIVTDPDGKIFEHFEYFPGGETWVLEHSDIHRTPYTFAGGYWDEMREIVNLGQRWYEPREQFFYSPDPIQIEAPTRVIDDAALLPAYTYAEANPLRLADRDGRAPEDIQRAFRAAFGRADGSIDTGKLAAFTSLALQRFNATHATSTFRVAAMLAAGFDLSKTDPVAARKTVDSLTERFGAKPLISISLNKTPKGVKVESVKVSPTFGGHEFTVKKQKKAKP